MSPAAPPELPGRPRRVRRRFLVALAMTVWLGSTARPGVRAQGMPARQVTLFGILATPNSNAIDSRLMKVAPQLRKLFPNHGFKLLGTQSKRLTPGMGFTCNLGGGFMTGTELVNVLDSDGKVQLKVALEHNAQTEFSTLVKTPPNQLFFLDKMMADGSRLLVGVGAR